MSMLGKDVTVCQYVNLRTGRYVSSYPVLLQHYIDALATKINTTTIVADDFLFFLILYFGHIA